MNFEDLEIGDLFVEEVVDIDPISHPHLGRLYIKIAEGKASLLILSPDPDTTKTEKYTVRTGGTVSIINKSKSVVKIIQ